jgi:hypothetical protein
MARRGQMKPCWTPLHTKTVSVGRVTVLGGAFLFSAVLAIARQSVPVGTGDARVDKLLRQMTLAAKLTLIHGGHEDPALYRGQAGYSERRPWASRPRSA